MPQQTHNANSLVARGAVKILRLRWSFASCVKPIKALCYGAFISYARVLLVPKAEKKTGLRILERSREAVKDGQTSTKTRALWEITMYKWYHVR